MFPAFEAFWRRVRGEPVSHQIDRWEHEYMAPWPELLSKLKESYVSEGADWKRVARRHVFPYLGDRLDRMRILHHELVRSLPGSWARTRRALHLRFPVRFVIYVGIGCGAGWATTYDGQPACLIGLENAAASHGGGDGWSRRVVAHEVAHLAHQAWRHERGDRQVDPWWTLYEEGFATYCERQIEPRSFPLRTGRNDWLAWCEGMRPWLARKFLDDVTARRSVRPFFGSWFNIQGYIETGYYLGSEVIRDWARGRPLRAVAVLPRPEIRRRARATLRRFAENRLPSPASTLAGSCGGRHGRASFRDRDRYFGRSRR
jgi:hypothetical protein